MTTRRMVTCAVCGARRRLGSHRVRELTMPETFTRQGEPVTIDPPAHVCESHFRVRAFVARTDPSR